MINACDDSDKGHLLHCISCSGGLVCGIETRGLDDERRTNGVAEDLRFIPQ